MSRYTRDQKIALFSLAVAILTLVATVVGIPDIRRAIVGPTLQRMQRPNQPSILISVNAPGLVGTIVVATAGTAGFLVARLRRLAEATDELERTALHDIFSPSGTELIFVVGPCDTAPGSIMPRVAVEDVLAMMNVIWLLTRNGINATFKLRDVAHLTDSDYNKLIVTIGGPRANSFTYAALQTTMAQFDVDEETDRWVLRFAEAEYPTATDAADDIFPEDCRRDYAVIGKVPNPHKHGRSVIVLAGTHGIGTWGAADHLRKEIVDLHATKREGQGFRKQGNFVVTVAVKYEDHNVISTDMLAFRDMS